MCVYCMKDHPANRCNVLTDVAARKKYLLENRRCFNCLKPNHQAEICWNNSTCYYCKGATARHHSSICEKFNMRGGECSKDDGDI